MADENRRHLTDGEFGQLKSGLIRIVDARPTIHLGKHTAAVRAIAKNTEATITASRLKGLKQTLLHAEKFFAAKETARTRSPQAAASTTLA